MTDRIVDIEAALERVIATAREHLAAVRAADGDRDDDAVWEAYVRLNNATVAYDDLLNEAFGEVTPFDLEEISGEEAASKLATLISGELGRAAMGDDPHPGVVSVRQRRDYRVPSVSALLLAAEIARVPAAEGEERGPVASVHEAVLELLESGDGSLGMLDLPELEPLDGVVVVVETPRPYDADAFEDGDGEGPFRVGAQDRTVARFDDHAFPDFDDE